MKPRWRSPDSFIRGGQNCDINMNYRGITRESVDAALTLSVGVVDPPLFDLGWGRRRFLLNGLLHDAAGVLHGALLQHPRAPLDAAHHDHHQHQQEQQHDHPREVLVDVKVLVGAWPWGTPARGPVVAGQAAATSASLTPALADPDSDHLGTPYPFHCSVAGHCRRVRVWVCALVLVNWGLWSPWGITVQVLGFWWGGNSILAGEQALSMIVFPIRVFPQLNGCRLTIGA